MNSPSKPLECIRSSRKTFILSHLFSAMVLFLTLSLAACGGGSGGGGGGGSGAASGSGIVVTGTLDSQSIQMAKIQGVLDRLYALISPRSAHASVQTITSILARSTDGSTTELASFSGSSFSISLPTGKTYLILLLDGTTTVGTLTVDPTSGMAIIPVSTSSQSFSLGTVSLSGLTATPTISESKLLTSLGINTTEAATLATYTQSVTWLENGDVDGDGILDYKENRFYKFILEYWFGHGDCTTSCSNPGPMFSSTEKSYAPTPSFSTMEKSYNFNIIEAGTNLASMPTFNTTGLNNNSCKPTSNIVLEAPSSVIAYGNTTISIDGCSYNSSANSLNLSLNGQSLNAENYEFESPGAPGGGPITNPTTPPTGTYKMTGTGTSNCGTNGCTLTFTNVSSIPLTKLTNIFFPSIKLTMSGSIVTGFSWQWYEYDFSTGTWIQPTLAVLQSVLSEATAEFGDINDANKNDVTIGITPNGTASVPDTGCNTTSACVRLSLQYGDIGGYIYQWGDF